MIFYGVFFIDGLDVFFKVVNVLFIVCVVINVVIYSCGCYIFIISCYDDFYFFVDVYFILKELGGVGIGFFKVYLV